MEKRSKVKPEFVKYYEQLRHQVKIDSTGINQDIRLSISAQDMTLSAFLRWISDKGGVSVVAEANLDKKLVVLDVVDQPVPEILGMVARRLGVQVTKSGSLYFMGKLRPEDRGVLVRKVNRLDQFDLDAAVSLILSEHGRAVAYADGVVIVGDRVEILQNINHLLDEIESAPAESWIVQLYLITYREGFDEAFGIDTHLGIDIATILAGVNSVDADIMVDGLFSALIEADRNKDSVEIIANPLFLMLDGQSASFNSGDQLRIPKRAVSDAGTVTTLDYEVVNTGLTVEVSLRDMGNDRAKLNVSVIMSDVTGFSGDAPIITQEEFRTLCSVHSGGVYLLGGVDRRGNQNQINGFFSSSQRHSNNSRQMQVWCRAYRVDKPIVKASGVISNDFVLPVP